MYARNSLYLFMHVHVAAPPQFGTASQRHPCRALQARQKILKKVYIYIYAWENKYVSIYDIPVSHTFAGRCEGRSVPKWFKRYVFEHSGRRSYWCLASKWFKIMRFLITQITDPSCGWLKKSKMHFVCTQAAALVVIGLQMLQKYSLKKWIKICLRRGKYFDIC